MHTASKKGSEDGELDLLPSFRCCLLETHNPRKVLLLQQRHHQHNLHPSPQTQNQTRISISFLPSALPPSPSSKLTHISPQPRHLHRLSSRPLDSFPLPSLRIHKFESRSDLESDFGALGGHRGWVATSLSLPSLALLSFRRVTFPFPLFFSSQRVEVMRKNSAIMQGEKIVVGS